MRFNKINNRVVLYKERLNMKHINNISTPKGRKVFSRRILFFLFLILAVIASILFLYLKRTVDQERKQDKIEKEITTEKEKDGVRNLHKKYKDMIGWLEIKGTGFSYPVMQTGIKGHHEGDWQYYLHRDVHGDYSFYGTPFLDVRCKTDSDNLIIYGHNINGRRYFGYLQNFREETFFRKHPKFSFTAVGEKEKEYCVVSVLETDKYADYYSFTDYGNEEDYCRMVEKILSHSKFQSEAAKKMKKEMDERDAEAFFRKYNIVTLSTCRTMDGRDKRLMVIGCRKR